MATATLGWMAATALVIVMGTVSTVALGIEVERLRKQCRELADDGESKSRQVRWLQEQLYGAINDCDRQADRLGDIGVALADMEQAVVGLRGTAERLDERLAGTVDFFSAVQGRRAIEGERAEVVRAAKEVLGLVEKLVAVAAADDDDAEEKRGATEAPVGSGEISPLRS